MDSVDHSFLSSISVRLEGYSIKSHRPYRANCRCPVCGDSKKSKSKKRGWFLENRTGGIVFHCHNCGYSHNLYTFLKDLYPAEFEDYTVAKYTQNKEEETAKSEFARPIPPKLLDRKSIGIRKISQLPVGHGAKRYVEQRMIPSKQHFRLYYAPRFVKWTNSIIPEKINENVKEHPRLVLPFFDKSGKMFGFQGRAFDESSLRYMSIMVDENQSKIFGLDVVDFSLPYYVVEGPIDSTFLNNSIAMAGADISANGIRNLHNAKFVFDMEPRNLEIVKRMEKCVSRGLNVCFWPEFMGDKGKDINDFVKSGMSIHDVERIIDENTKSGLMAELELSRWRKC